MKMRTFKILLIWLMPISMLLVTWIRYEKLVEINFLIPLWIATPIGMFLSYIIYIKGIEDGLFFKVKKEIKK